MKLIDLLINIRPLITGGGKFQWNCFGDNSWMLDLNKASVVFDTETNEIYEIEFHEYTDNHEDWVIYRWFHPDYQEQYLKENAKHPTSNEYVEEYIKLNEIITKIKEDLKNE